MDSPLTGSKNILSVQTDKVSVIIKGKSSHKYSHNLKESQTKCSSVCIRCNSDFTVAIDDSNYECISKIETEPLFFEQQRYEILIEGLNKTHDLSFWHENINIRNDVTYVGNHKDLLSGILNFGNDIGYSDLVVLSDTKEILRIRIEVFPSKISYKEDYQALIQDVISEVYNLVFDFLKKTYSQLGINSETKASPIEFYSIIERIFRDFEKALNVIIRNPYHVLETIREILPAHKSKRVDSRSLKWIQNHPDYIKRTGSSYNVEKILTPKKQVTYDTKENQFLKFILIATQKKLRNFEENYKQLGREIQPEIILKIERMIHSLDKTLSTTFLQEVSVLNSTNLMSLVFTMAPGYRDIYKYYLMLQHGLSLTGDMFNLSFKDIAELYEYWCFIKLNRILKDKKYTLASPDILKVEIKGITVNLKKGTSSIVKYLNPKNQEIIELSYNPSKRESPTGPQRPDNVLSIQKKGSSKYQYVFDAKYRIDDGSDSNDPERLTPGPKEDAINTMHRYRDAIVYDDKMKNGKVEYERSMFGAYVLFPYNNEEEYKEHKFYKSIEKVNVGGLPFLPSATELVSNFIEELIEDSPDSAFERATLPAGIEEKLKTVDWNKKDVLIGMLRKDQLQKNLEHKFYHIPADQIADNDLPIHWIALYQSKDIYKDNPGIHYYGEVIRCYRIKRRSITEIPARVGTEEQYYYRFDVKCWKELEHPITVKEFGPPNHRFTNLFLLQNSSIFPELFLKDEEEFRIYNEIKYRISNPQYVENPFCFSMNGKSLFFDNNEIKVTEGQRIIDKISFNEFLKAPHSQFKQILEMLH